MIKKSFERDARRNSNAKKEDQQDKSTPIQKEAKKKQKKKNERVKIKIFPRLSCPAKMTKS